MAFGTRLAVDVEGGTLAVGRAGADAGPAVLCLHGISSSHLAWGRVAAELLAARPDARVIGPDARGRGRSDAIAGPFGIAHNAGDALAVLDALGIERAVVAGHSMGGWVAARLAAEHPDRVSAVVLVDGGVSEPGGGQVTTEVVLEPVLERLRRTFSSEAEYLDFWRAQPAYSDGRFDAHVEACARYDLRGRPPALRARAREEAVRADFGDMRDDPRTCRAEHAVRAPAALVRAGRGLLDEPTPFIGDEAVRGFRERHPGARVHELPDVNHDTVILGSGATVTAAAIADALP